MKITVTQDDIDRGCRTSTHGCPIARSLQREGFKKPTVTGWSVWIADPQEILPATWLCNLPVEAWQFVYDFDIGIPVKPFSFDILEVS